MNNLYSISSGFKRHKRSTLFSNSTNMFPIMFFNFFVISNGINGIKFIKPFTIICFFQYFFSLFVFGTFSNKTVIDVSCLKYHLYLHLCWNYFSCITPFPIFANFIYDQRLLLVKLVFCIAAFPFSACIIF